MIELFTAPTPNGHKISIMLEETGLPYTVRPMDLGRREQKEPWYLDLNPQGRIPTIVDHGNDGFSVFESGAILIYLAEKSGMLLPSDAGPRSRVLQWLMFQMAYIGPMMGQANVFYRYAPEKIPYAIERYCKETRRLIAVLERRLDGRDFLVDDYSIADIACYPWVRQHDWSGVAIDDMPRVRAWLGRIAARPAVQRGMAVPEKEEVSDEASLGRAIDAGRRILD